MLGIMYTLSDMSTHNTLSPGYETPDYECRYFNKVTDKLWWTKDSVCGWEVQ